MTAVYFPTSGYINVAFRKEDMTFVSLFSVKYLREAGGTFVLAILSERKLRESRKMENSGERPSR